MQRDPVPEGRSKSLSVPQIFVVETELLIPGYYRAVPPGQKPFAHRGASQLSSRLWGLPWDSQNNVLSTGRFEVEDFAKQIRRFNARTAGA